MIPYEVQRMMQRKGRRRMTVETIEYIVGMFNQNNKEIKLDLTAKAVSPDESVVEPEDDSKGGGGSTETDLDSGEAGS